MHTRLGTCEIEQMPWCQFLSLSLVDYIFVGFFVSDYVLYKHTFWTQHLVPWSARNFNIKLIFCKGMTTKTMAMSHTHTKRRTRFRLKCPSINLFLFVICSNEQTTMCCCMRSSNNLIRLHWHRHLSFNIISVRFRCINTHRLGTIRQWGRKYILFKKFCLKKVFTSVKTLYRRFLAAHMPSRYLSEESVYR